MKTGAPNIPFSSNQIFHIHIKLMKLENCRGNKYKRCCRLSRTENGIIEGLINCKMVKLSEKAYFSGGYRSFWGSKFLPRNI